MIYPPPPPEVTKYDLPQIVCTIYPPEIAKCGSVVYELVTLASVVIECSFESLFFGHI